MGRDMIGGLQRDLSRQVGEGRFKRCGSMREGVMDGSKELAMFL
jgi:hypothetical protein